MHDNVSYISKDKLISTSIKKKMTDKEGKNLKKFRWLIDMTFVSHSIIGEISTILTIEHVRNRVLHNFIMIIVGKIG